jgi:hypothetical protein
LFAVSSYVSSTLHGFCSTPTSLYSSPLVGCLVVLGQLLQLQLCALPQSDQRAIMQPNHQCRDIAHQCTNQRTVLILHNTVQIHAAAHHCRGACALTYVLFVPAWAWPGVEFPAAAVSFCWPFCWPSSVDPPCLLHRFSHADYFKGVMQTRSAVWSHRLTWTCCLALASCTVVASTLAES